MTLDGLSLRVITDELAELNGSKIEKIYQPTKDDVVLLLHTKEGKKRLALSASGGDCRVVLTGFAEKNPDKAPNFCMLLRKYILSGRIESIHQLGFERIVELEITSRDEIGVENSYKLICEIMGKYSNIILTRDTTVLDSIHRVPPDMSSVRQILPGVKYSVIPLEKLDPLEAPEQEIAEKIMCGRIMPFVAGISDVTEREIFFRALGEERPGTLTPKQSEKAARALKQLFTEAIGNKKPCVHIRDSKPYFYSPVPFHTFPEEDRICCKSMNEAVDMFFGKRRETAILENKKSGIARVLKKAITRTEKNLKIQSEALLSSEKGELARLYGELLNAGLYSVKRGAKEAAVFNYYTNENITIPLDPSKSPSANVNAYFKKSSKLKTAAALAKNRCAELSGELDYLRELEYELKAADTPDDAEEIRLDLIRFGYIEHSEKKKIIRKDPLEDPVLYLSSDGHKIFAGRNNRQNDALTFHAAGKEDIWFHVKNAPGSHVILFTEGKEPSDSAIEEAASIAVLHSSVKNASAEVDYTRVKNVWKANGAKPGMVLFKAQNTIVADPEKAEYLRRKNSK